jgi:hypothetical protein
MINALWYKAARCGVTLAPSATASLKVVRSIIARLGKIKSFFRARETVVAMGPNARKTNENWALHPV